MSLQYEMASGSYYLYDQNTQPNKISNRRKILIMTDQIAIAFDRETGTMHKHGNPKNVETWAQLARKRFCDFGQPDMAAQIVVVSGNLPVEEVNKCLSISGYCKVLYAKLGTLSEANKQM